MTFSRFDYLHFSSHETPPLHRFLQLKHFKNGIFCTEEGSVLIPEHYIPPFKNKGGISVQNQPYFLTLYLFRLLFHSYLDI
nr:MAG TPA: hypothetical protein [Caudoviricetes sp.]